MREAYRPDTRGVCVVASRGKYGHLVSIQVRVVEPSFSFPCDPRRRRVRQTTCHGKSKSVICKSPISPVENHAEHRRDRKHIQRVGPPDSLHQIPVHISATNEVPVGQKQPQINKQFLTGEVERGADPLRLERSDLNSSPTQTFLPERNPSPTEAARVVVQDDGSKMRPMHLTLTDVSCID